MITKYTEYIKEESIFTGYNSTKNWLDNRDIKNYHINKDLTVDTTENVNINNQYLINIYVKFNISYADFDCSHNQLNNLMGCPDIVIGNFDCSYNRLITLKGCPKKISGKFRCYGNILEDINDLDSKILIKNIKNIEVSGEVFDKYFEEWIEKDINIFDVLKDKVTDKIKTKYDYLFNAKNFDLI